MKSKLLFLSFILTVFCSCDSKDEVQVVIPEPELAKADIINARSLYLVSSPSTKSQSGEGVLCKIDDAGITDVVEFTDKNGDKLDISINYLAKVSDEYIIVIGEIHRQYAGNVSHAVFENYWLVRKKDGGVFELEHPGTDILGNLSNHPSTLMIDRSGNFYWLSWDQSMWESTLYKSSSLENGDLTATSISGDFERIGWCYMDNQDVILMEADEEWFCRLPDGTYIKDEGGDSSYDMKGIHRFPVKKSIDGGFIVLDEVSISGGWGTKISKITVDKSNSKVIRTEIAIIDQSRYRFVHRDDMPDGGYVFYTNDYKDYIYFSPTGDFEVISYETGFQYGNRRTGDNCIYGVGGSTIYKMDFDTRVTTKVFSDSRFRIDDYQVAPDNSSIEIFALRYSDARKILLRVVDNQIVSEQLQSEGAAEVITFIRLN